MRKLMERELDVPAAAMMEVVGVLNENNLTATITGSDEDEQTITIELQYEKSDRSAIHAIEDIIEEYSNDEDDDNDEEEEDDD